jgi:hypothetical protein
MSICLCVFPFSIHFLLGFGVRLGWDRLEGVRVHHSWKPPVGMDSNGDLGYRGEGTLRGEAARAKKVVGYRHHEENKTVLTREKRTGKNGRLFVLAHLSHLFFPFSMFAFGFRVLLFHIRSRIVTTSRVVTYRQNHSPISKYQNLARQKRDRRRRETDMLARCQLVPPQLFTQT